jgi:hypothetical protein
MFTKNQKVISKINSEKLIFQKRICESVASFFMPIPSFYKTTSHSHPSQCPQPD